MELKLFAVLLGGRPRGCTIEQHNVFFGIGSTLEELYPAIKKFWAAAPKIHVDAYMVIDQVGDYDIIPVKTGDPETGENSGPKLFFVNLGGYRAGVFEEVHKKLFIVAPDVFSAVRLAKKDPFFHEGVNEGKVAPHIDDKKELGEFEDDVPLDVLTLLEPQGFNLSIKKVRTGSETYPEPVITGYLQLP